MKIRKVVLTVLLATAGVAVASLTRWEVWDGSFLQAEYRVTFLDKANRPVKDVQLKVLDSHGNPSFGYPVTDFTEGSIPTSDDQGMMTFHHVSLPAEFGGSCCRLFFVLPVGKCEAPHYTLLFFLSGSSVARIGYTDLENLGRTPDWNSLPVVKREWEQKALSPPSLPEHLRIENRSLPLQLDFYVIKRTIIVR